METYKSTSNVMPQEWQKEIDYIYHNKNIKVVEKETDKGLEIVYEYDVDKYTLTEYINLELQKNKTSIKDLEDAICELGEIIGG